MVWSLSLFGIAIGSVLLGLPFSEDDLRQDSKEAANTFDAPASSEPHVGSWKELPRHRDEDQVQLDVNRAFIYYPDRMHSRVSPPRSLLGPSILFNRQPSIAPL